MLIGVHFLLTYSCNFECDHCFLYCSPNAVGTFTYAQVKEVLDESKRLGSVESIYFEGGEPFLYYPLMLEGLRTAKAMGFKTGIVTNCYWATSEIDAAIWLKPLVETGIDDLSLSDDAFHHGENENSPAKLAAKAAKKLGLPSISVCIEEPTARPPSDDKGEPVIGGGALFKGRAADKLTEGLPTKPIHTFTECKHEELVSPKRVHIDSYGNVHVCQGLSIGNMWEVPFSKLISEYDAKTHPICAPLVEGGPAELAKKYDVKIDSQFVDECHYCYLARKELISKFPHYLTPPQVYGVTESSE